MAATAPRSAAGGKTAAKATNVKVGEPASQDRGLRRALFLAELAEARELRKRVAPRKARAAERHARLLRTFRY